MAGQNLMVRPSLKNGTRLALTQRSKVRGATFSSLDSSETLRAESELRSLSASDRDEADCDLGTHRPSFCEASQPHGTSSPLAYLPPVGLDARLVRCSGEVLNCIITHLRATHKPRRGQQRGIRTDQRLRPTPYRGFLRKLGDYFLRPVVYPRLISVIGIFRQLTPSAIKAQHRRLPP